MEYTIHRISLDIHSVKSQATLKVKQADTSRKLHITLCEGGLPYHISEDCHADFSALKADGNYIYNSCQISGNAIEYTFTEQTTAAVGAVECEITLYDSMGQRITSPHFTIIVEERVYNGEEIVSSPEANALDELIDRAETAVGNAEKVVDSIYHYVDNNFANAFKGAAEGAVVQVNDVSPVEHNVECKVRSKNLFDISKIKTLTTVNGISISEVGEDSITITTDDSYTGNGYINISVKLKELCPQLEVGKTYILSAVSEGSVKSFYFPSVASSWSFGKSVVMTEMMLNSDVVMYGLNTTKDQGVGDCTVSSIQIEEGSEATSYVPYVDPATVTVTRCGKNLAPPNLYSGKVGGYTYTPNEDGTMTISGAATTISEHIIALALKSKNGDNLSVPLKANETYTLTVRKNGEKVTKMGTKVLNADGTIKWGFDKTSTQDRELTLVYVQFTPQLGDTEFCGTYSVQLEKGNAVTDYEPYAGDIYSANTDGTVNGMTSLSPSMTIFTDTANTVISCEYNRDSNKVVTDLYNYITGETMPPVTKISSVELLHDKWVGDASPYSQVVSIVGITENSMVDLTPTVEQLSIFYNKDLAFVTENVDGVVTVYAIGQKPANDYTIPIAITEVDT